MSSSTSILSTILRLFSFFILAEYLISSIIVALVIIIWSIFIDYSYLSIYSSYPLPIIL